jgi:hypothetical protein
MTVTRMRHSGAWVVTDIINGYYEQEVYYGYTKKEAIALFKEKYNVK